MTKMSQQERFNYLTGLIDMLAFQVAQSKNSAKAIFITNTYYREGKENAWAQLLDTLKKFPEQSPETVVTVLANKRCGA